MQEDSDVQGSNAGGHGRVPWWLPILTALIGAAGAIGAAYVLAQGGGGPFSGALPTVTAAADFHDTAQPTVTVTPPTVTVTAPTVTVTAEGTGASPSDGDDYRAVVSVQPQWSRTDIGPNQVRLLDGRAPMYVGWEVRKDNQTLDGTDCAVRVTLEGPGDHPTLPSSKCSQGPGYSDFTFAVRDAGDYRAVVVDEVTGATGFFDFTVVN